MSRTLNCRRKRLWLRRSTGKIGPCPCLGVLDLESDTVKPRLERVLTAGSPGSTAFRDTLRDLPYASSDADPEAAQAITAHLACGPIPQGTAELARRHRSLGSERGLATPSPDGKGREDSSPSKTIMPCDS